MNYNRTVSLLDDFNSSARLAALKALAADKEELPSPRRGWTNMHCHTFFSFNAYGFSPSRFAWEAREKRLEAGGIVDFDCLDGTGEFLNAGRLLGLKTCAGLETRVYIPEYSDKVINSPKEPGVFYLSGIGFVKQPPADGGPADVLNSMRERAGKRNVDMMTRINDYLAEVKIDYEAEVLPRTPAGNATERHMLSAYAEKAEEMFPDPRSRAKFWAEKLNEPAGKIADMMDDAAELESVIRNKLMKHGGVGYVKPGPDTFPDIDEVINMILKSGAVPSACWLDGASEGEKNPQRHLAFLKQKGCACVTIVPDRNWNVPTDEQAWKVENLNKIISASKELDMFLIAGTEMNKYGNRFVDDFDSPELSPHREIFRRGAMIAWGHTLLTWFAGITLLGEWSGRHFSGDAAGRNDFFASVGELPYPSDDVIDTLSEMDSAAGPEDFIRAMR